MRDQPKRMIAVSKKLLPRKFRKLIPGRCHYCSRQFFSDKHTGRPRLFCDKKCRDGGFRRSRYLTSKNGETVSKKEGNSKACKGIFGDRPLPLNILGGYRWPDCAVVDRQVLSAIIQAEIRGTALTPARHLRDELSAHDRIRASE
jgi:hypothetical protein